MGGTNELLKKYLSELSDQNTTPEKALQILSYPCIVPGKRGGEKNAVIFLVYISFIIKRLPDGCVVRIWEDILMKTLLYSKDFDDDDCGQWGVGTWLDNALTSSMKCPNPYVRLQLFRLLSLFCGESGHLSNDAWERISNAFISTICEIKPHHLYLNGDGHVTQFDVYDLNTVIAQCCYNGRLQRIISKNIIEQLCKTTELDVESLAARFLSNCIQLIGVFAVMASSIPDPKEQIHEIRACCRILRGEMGLLVNCGDHLPGLSLWKQFGYVVSRQPVRHYLDETVRNLTTAIMASDRSELLYYIRDSIVNGLGIFTKTNKLPRLLLYRQIQGPSPTYQHSLLISKLDNTSCYYQKDSSKEDTQCGDIGSGNIVAFIPIIDEDNTSLDDSFVSVIDQIEDRYGNNGEHDFVLSESDISDISNDSEAEGLYNLGFATYHSIMNS